MIGTLNTLYSQVGHLHYQVEQFHLWSSLREAVLTIPHNLRELSQALVNPLLAKSPDRSLNPSVYG